MTGIRKEFAQILTLCGKRMTQEKKAIRHIHSRVLSSFHICNGKKIDHNQFAKMFFERGSRSESVTGKRNEK